MNISLKKLKYKFIFKENKKNIYEQNFKKYKYFRNENVNLLHFQKKVLKMSTLLYSDQKASVIVTFRVEIVLFN